MSNHRDDTGFAAVLIALIAMFTGMMILLFNYKPVDRENESTGVRDIQPKQQQRK